MSEVNGVKPDRVKPDRVTPDRVRVQLAADEVQQRRLWLSIALGTMIITVSTWAFLYAFLAEADGGIASERSLGAVALGMALLPAAFATVAFVSAHPAAPLATLQAMAMSLIVGIPVLALTQDGLSGLVAGYGIGAAYALCPAEHTRLGTRVAAVAVATASTVVLAHTMVPLALASAPALPLVSVALADRYRQPA